MDGVPSKRIKTDNEVAGSVSSRPRFLKPSETSSYLDKETNSTLSIDSTDFVYNKNLSRSIQTQRQSLPIFNNRNHILYLLEKFQTLVLVGETGCGKSTQLPQYMIEAEWPGQIGICEPRRVAAISLANRVAEEMGALVQDDTVGYSVRFDSCKTKPKIKYMTEGILIREIMSNPLLNNYSAIMLDEVHERTLYTDILMGLLKKVSRKRPELRLIVASATLDARELQSFFNNNATTDKKLDTSVIMSVAGRQYPVDVFYLTHPVPCYVKASVETVMDIHKNKDPGDILIFLTGQEEVDRTCKLLEEHADLLAQSSKGENLYVVPMYGSLPYNQQLKAFKRAPEGHRKVVVATNIAETSVTIPGIVHVIDCGFSKMKFFNIETHTDMLMVVPISKSSANQRAGRAGRVRSGKVYRLYTEESAEQLEDNTPPEMVRSNLTFAVLQLKAMGIQNLVKFKFPSPPPEDNLKSALEILYALDAIDIDTNLTSPLGFYMTEFALDPVYSKMLLSSGELGCSEEILTIVSMLQVESVFVKPSGGSNILKARVQKRLFEVEEGDLIMYLNVYNGFLESECSQQFCQMNFLNYKCLKRVCEVRRNLEKMLFNYNIPLVSAKSTETIRKCLVTGLFPNAAFLHYSGVYKTVRGEIDLHIHTNSLYYPIEQPQWVVFCELVHGDKLYIRDITKIERDWLTELAPHFYYLTNSAD